AKRPQIQSKQRAININSQVVSKIFDTNTPEKNQIIIRCLRDGSQLPPEERPLVKSGKNWRLGGKAIRDKDLATVSAGDYFVGLLSIDQKRETLLRRQIISAAGDSVGHQEIKGLTSSLLHDSMAAVVEGDALFGPLRARVFQQRPQGIADQERTT